MQMLCDFDQNVIALLHMAEEHLRLSSGDVLSNVDDSYDLMNVSNALACYGSHAVIQQADG